MVFRGYFPVILAIRPEHFPRRQRGGERSSYGSKEILDLAGHPAGDEQSVKAVSAGAF